MVSGFAPVAPISILEGLHSRQALGHYNLVLSHNVLEQRKRFIKLVENQYPLGGIWIVDNSVIELGIPVSAEDIAEACQIFKLNRLNEVVAVLPDELLDCLGTIDVTVRAIKTFRAQGLSNFMFVPQGKTEREIIQCAEEFQNVEEIKWIGVARNFESDNICLREDIIPVLRAIYPKAKLHLLGFSRNTANDLRCAKMDGVRGIDSAMPLRLNEPISILSEYPKRGDWWKEDMECTDLMVANVIQVRKWLGN